MSHLCHLFPAQCDIPHHKALIPLYVCAALLLALLLDLECKAVLCLFIIWGSLASSELAVMSSLHMLEQADR